MSNSRAQIVATVGPASAASDILTAMIDHQTDLVRINFSWADFDDARLRLKRLHQIEADMGKRIPVIADMPGPRIQKENGHEYDRGALSAITDKDREVIAFAAEERIDYVAVSFVGSAADVEACRSEIAKHGGTQRVIAKIERTAALEHLDEIIAAADAIMVARGDLAHELPLGDMPYVQKDIVAKCNVAGKPVITATGLLSSMIDHPEPSRADVTDITDAIIEGSDAVMLSDETATGKYPVEAITVMETIVKDAEAHMQRDHINAL